MDKKLLLNLFKIPSQSKKEHNLSSFIKSFLKEIKIPFTEDKKGNIFNINHKGLPILSAHMDSVQDDIDAKLTDFIKIREDILSGYGVIGADDKCGIYIILNLLKDIKFNFIFSVEEEIGAFGIQYFLKHNILKNIPYGLVLDRRGSKDIICTNNQYGSKNFEDSLIQIGEVYGYSTDYGTFSDADYLNEQISCANLSVGYYNPHTKNEFVLLESLKNAEQFVHAIVKNLKENFRKPYKYNKYFDGMNNHHNNYYHDYYDDYEESSCIFCGKTTNLFYLKTLDKHCCSLCYDDFCNDAMKNGLEKRHKKLEFYNV